MTKNAKILLVDDDETLLVMYEQILTARGFKVVTVRDGQQVLQAAKTERPDLILLDILLPNRNGIDILKGLRQESTLKSMPVIMLTVLNDEAKKSEAEAAGANRFFNKSETIPGKIVEAIETELKKKTSVGH